MDPPLVRRAAGVLAGTLVLAGAVACSGESDDTPRPRPSGSSQQRTAQPSAPMRVEVTRVAGTLPAKRRTAVVAGVRRSLASYVRGGFLGGRYPRAHFEKAFDVFTRETARAARRDQALLTNRSLGSSTTSVRAVRRTAYLSVLAPEEKVSGVTAAVDLVFVVDRGDAPDRRVHLEGRMLLTRERSGRWAVFGYDLSRSQTARKKGPG